MPRYGETLGIRRTSQSNDRQVLPTPMTADIKANASATVAGDRCVRRCAWPHEYFDPTGIRGSFGLASIVASENEFCKNPTSKDIKTRINSESNGSISGHKHSLDQYTGVRSLTLKAAACFQESVVQSGVAGHITRQGACDLSSFRLWPGYPPGNDRHHQSERCQHPYNHCTCRKVQQCCQYQAASIA